MSKLGKKLIAAAQTFHGYGCDCDFCKSGETKFPVEMCQATSMKHCQFPRCDCNRPGIQEELLDPIQNNCTYGYVLPDRCQYMAHLGCDCGAYPPLKWDGEKYVSPQQVVHK